MSGRISPLRASAASRGVTCPLGESACTAPRWKISPSTAPRSSTERSCGSSWSRRAASSARSVGRDGDLAVRLARHRHHLGEEERVAAGGARDPRAQVVVEAVRQAARRPRPAASGSSRMRSGPRGAPLDQLRPRHAKEKKRRIASKQGGRLDEVEEASPLPTGCRRRAPPAAPAPRAACGRPRRSPRRPPTRRSRPAASGSTRPRPGRREGRRAASAPRPAASR